jgi:retron-type reverse transcriptase
VRLAAAKDRDARFTALLHHVDVDRLRGAYRALSPKAAAGVDGETWESYGQNLGENLEDLLARVQRGAYRAKPSRRVYIPKADGRLRPLGIAALEDKIVQRAVVEVLNAIYETDFLGFSYGFRPGRGPHDALDALTVAIENAKVNWVLDADFRDFFTSLDHSWLVKFLEHRIADKRVLRTDPEIAQGRRDRGRQMDGQRAGLASRGDGLAAAGQCLPALRLRSVGPAMAVSARSRRGDRRQVCR